MVCGDVRAQLLAPEASASSALAAHLSGCRACAAVAAAVSRLDAALRVELLTLAPEALATRLEGLVGAPSPAAGAERRRRVAAGEGRVRAPSAATIDAAVRASIVVDPPAKLMARLMGLVPNVAAERVDRAVQASVLVEPPLGLQAQLAALVDPEPAVDALGWLAGVWQSVKARPAVLAGQLAAAAVLAYVVVQVFSWLGSLPLVVGDIPYALELLVLSPAVDYLGQIEGLLQQLSLWLLVAAAGWLFVQGWPFQRQIEP